MHRAVRISRTKHWPTEGRHLVPSSENGEGSPGIPHSFPCLLFLLFSFFPLLSLFLFFFSRSFHSFFFFPIIAPTSMVIYLGRWQGLHRFILLFSYSFILFGYSNASSLMCFRFYFILPTWARPWCLCSRRRHHLLLSRGSVGVRPSSFSLGPFVGGVKGPFHLCFFYPFFVCTTAKHSRHRRHHAVAVPVSVSHHQALPIILHMHLLSFWA